ncbi:DUF6107 family protein [Rhizobium giardinii]|uniref:DUF6107 family protein n=1 Tax=Rhizobium giardinii TaxID=56731 RepID=UPI0039E05068
MTEWFGAKIIGIIAGSFLALVFLPPRSIPGFVRRALSALVFGWVFGPVVHDYLQWPMTDEKIIASGAIAAFSSWWTMGLIRRFVENYKKETE